MMTTYEMVERQSAGRECEVGNALVHQKNKLLERIDLCREPEEFRNVMEKLELLAPLWKTLRYGYKTREVYDRLINRMYRIIDEEKDLLRGERKNSRARTMAENAIKIIDNLIADCCIARAS